MEREELRTLTLEHPWTPETLRNHFAHVCGGVAFPGRRPGHAIVAGLCQPRARNNFEAHVLAEAESRDLGELLRACRALGRQYRPAGMLRREAFSWYGDGKNVGACELLYRINAETKNTGDHLSIETTTILEMPAPYSYMCSILAENTRGDRKRLFLHDARAALGMNELDADEVADARIGDHPAVEALAFVVDELRTWLDQRPDERLGDTNPYRNWDRFNRGRRRGLAGASRGLNRGISRGF